MPEPSPPQRLVVRISARTAVVVVVAFVLAVMTQRVFLAAHAPLSWAVAAAVAAVLVDPIVDVLDKRIPRLPAVIVALLVLAAAVWGVIYVAFDDLAEGVDRLGESAQEAAGELEDRNDGVGRLARDVDAQRRVDLFVEALDDRVTGGDDVLANTAGTAPTYFVSGILTLFLMSYGPRLAQSAVEQLPEERTQREIAHVVQTALQRSRRAIFLTVGEGLVVGLAVAGAARLLDVPSAAALGLAAGVMALLPHVGLVLGTLPLVLLVLALRSDLATLVTVGVVITCQLLDSFLVRRRISHHSVHIGLLVPWVVILVGYTVYGVGGAAYGLAFAVFALAVLDELRRRTPDPVPGGDDHAEGSDDEQATDDAAAGPRASDGVAGYAGAH